MIFTSLEFVLLLIITLLLFYLLPAKMRLYLLTLADIVFYLAAGINYLLLLIIISTIVYFCAIKVWEQGRRIYLWLGILTAAVNLIFFKYTGFILANICLLIPGVNIQESQFITNIVLPLGISFYTFQMIAYLVDVAGEKTQPCRNIILFWVFISFFGKLIAGPIMRGKDLLPQLENAVLSRFRYEDIKSGFYYIVLGLTKKIVLADTLAPRVDYYFNHIALLNSFDAWFAAYLFAFQLYFDFSAYSDIAVGVGRLFGLRLSVNFMTPYISANPTEFWRRWHITLSSWIMDYIYIPLGGSRKGLFLQCLFFMAAMGVSGLWHGASWTFVVLGLYHGLLLVVYKLLPLLNKNRPSTSGNPLLGRAISVFIFFQLTVLGWVFFRAGAIDDGFQLITKMLSFSQIEFNPVYLLYFSFIALMYALHCMEHLMLKHKTTLLYYWENKAPAGARAAFYAILVIIFVMCIKTEQNSFIYFQF